MKRRMTAACACGAALAMGLVQADRAVQVRHRGRACSRARSSCRARRPRASSARPAPCRPANRSAGRLRRTRGRHRARNNSPASGRRAASVQAGSKLSRMLRTATGEVATLSVSRSTRSPKLSSARASNCRSCWTATSSARCAEESTATTMQTMATATITPIGTTTLKRARSQLVYCWRGSGARARLGKIRSPKRSKMLDFSVRTVALNACHFAFVSPPEGLYARRAPQFTRLR